MSTTNADATPESTETDSADLPTMPSSVVWSGRHAYVLERVLGRNRWVGVDDRGRPVALSCADLERKGWRPAC